MKFQVIKIKQGGRSPVSLFPEGQDSRRRSYRTCLSSADTGVLLVTTSPGKLLDVDDQYYQQLSSSRPQPCSAAKTPTPDAAFIEGQSPDGKRSAGGRVSEQAATEAEPHRTDGDNRQVQQHVHQSASDEVTSCFL